MAMPDRTGGSYGNPAVGLMLKWKPRK